MRKSITKKTSTNLKKNDALMRRLVKIHDRLENATVEITVCAGMLTVVANCKQQILNVKIDPEILKSEDIELLEELLATAVTHVLQKAKLLLQEQTFEKIKPFLPEIEQGIKTLAEADKEVNDNG